LNAEVAQEQGELFTTWRYHPVFTDSPFALLAAELDHRRHAVVELGVPPLGEPSRMESPARLRTCRPVLSRRTPHG
jgi:hypothetical protein